MSTLLREDAAYLAGLLDGEGCFDSPRGNPRLRVKMGDLDVVMRAADLMGTSVTTEIDKRIDADGKPYSPMFVAALTGEPALDVMRSVLPWLGARRSFKVAEITAAHAMKKKGRITLRRAA